VQLTHFELFCVFLDQRAAEKRVADVEARMRDMQVCEPVKCMHINSITEVMFNVIAVHYE